MIIGGMGFENRVLNEFRVFTAITCLVGSCTGGRLLRLAGDWIKTSSAVWVVVVVVVVVVLSSH